MATEAGPILAVIDCAADDADVLAEAVWLARAAQTHVLLVHVARPLGRGELVDRAAHEIGFEQRLLRELQELAERARSAGVAAQVEDLYFGDPATEVAYAANRSRASAVVAARRPPRFFGMFGWLSRDARLGRLLSIPLVLTGASARRALDAAQAPLALEPVR